MFLCYLDPLAEHLKFPPSLQHLLQKKNACDGYNKLWVKANMFANRGTFAAFLAMIHALCPTNIIPDIIGKGFKRVSSKSFCLAVIASIGEIMGDRGPQSP